MGSVVSGVLGMVSSSDAANAQTHAANMSIAEQEKEFGIIHKDMHPFLGGGQLAENALLKLLGINGKGQINVNKSPLLSPFTMQKFQSSPGYAFQQQQGIDAIQNSAAARGGINSGNTLKSLDTFGQGLANQDYWNQYNAYTTRQNQNYNMLSGMTGQGIQAGNILSNAGQNMANNVSSNLIGMGNAQAGGIMGQANSLASIFNGLGTGGSMSSGGIGSLLSMFTGGF